MKYAEGSNERASVENSKRQKCGKFYPCMEKDLRIIKIKLWRYCRAVLDDVTTRAFCLLVFFKKMGVFVSKLLFPRGIIS